MMAKYSGEDSTSLFRNAESAIARALELNPDQGNAHMLQAQIETDLGRAAEAMVRLVGYARRNGRSAEVFAGLCYACRYCGLVEESLAADDRARELDPTLVTSVVHTHFLLGNDARVVELLPSTAYGYTGLIALIRLGRTAEALDAARQQEAAAPAPFRALVRSARELIEGRNQDSARSLDEVVTGIPDPEALFYVARQLAYLGEARRSLDALSAAISAGYLGLAAGHQDHWFDGIRHLPEFARLCETAATSRHAALMTFQQANEGRVLP
jgi:tetratricopeptide (TPR) repeat protein